MGCPELGSGAEGVAAWFEENCEGEAENPATTCSGEFTIELVSVDAFEGFVTFEYEVCKTEEGSADLSHWSIATGGINCLADGYTIQDLILRATFNGEDIALELGLDPTTQVVGLKFDDGEDGCNAYTVTFDTSVLEDGYTIGTGTVLASTKAGNQDIRSGKSPGYACIVGPVCVLIDEEDECVWIGETAWADGANYVVRGNWATYTPYPSEGTVTLFAGQHLDAGTVTFGPVIDGQVLITIKLNGGDWRFAEDEEGNSINENLKIQGYGGAPSGNPSPGQFTTSKTTESGQSATVTVDAFDFYGIHVDVEWESCISVTED